MVREDLLDPRIIHRSLMGGEATCFAWFAIAIAIAIDLRFDERVVVRFASAIAIAIDLRFDKRVVVRREFERDVLILRNRGHSYPKGTKGQKKQGKLKSMMGNCLKLNSMGNCLETSSNGVRPELQGVKTSQDMDRMEKIKAIQGRANGAESNTGEMNKKFKENSVD